MAQELHTFKAATLNEAYRKMREALGDDAVVLRAHEVKEGGVLGFMGRTLHEVTAAAPGAGSHASAQAERGRAQVRFGGLSQRERSQHRGVLPKTGARRPTPDESAKNDRPGATLERQHRHSAYGRGAASRTQTYAAG